MEIQTNTCATCDAQLQHLKGNIKVKDAFVNEIDRRVIMLESNYGHISGILDKLGDQVGCLDIKVDNLKDIVIEKKVAKELKDKARTIIYNSSLWIIALLGIYDMLTKLVGKMLL